MNSLSNVSELVAENNLTTRRNLRANIEKQSLQINEKFISAFQDAFQNMQILSDQVNFIDKSCQTMMSKIEVCIDYLCNLLRGQIHDLEFVLGIKISNI